MLKVDQIKVCVCPGNGIKVDQIKSVMLKDHSHKTSAEGVCDNTDISCVNITVRRDEGDDILWTSYVPDLIEDMTTSMIHML